MSIDIDRFDDRPPEELVEASNSERVLRFLFENRDRAWKAREIAKRADVHENSIHPVLSRLEERELVRHKGPYWAITNDFDRLRRASDLHRVIAAFEELYGTEDRTRWTGAADRDAE